MQQSRPSSRKRWTVGIATALLCSATTTTTTVDAKGMKGSITASAAIPESVSGGGAGGWFGGVNLDGKVYGIPANAAKVLAFDPATGQVSGSEPIPASVATATGSQWSGGVAIDGKIYGVPYLANHVMIYDPKTKRVSGSGQVVPNGTAPYNKWFGGVAVRGKMYGIPYFANSLLIYDPNTNTASNSAEVPPAIKGSAATAGWSAGVAYNGKVYGMPYFSAHVLIYDVEADEVTGSEKVPESIAEGGGYQWSGGVVFKSKIYGIPRNAKHVLIYDPSTNKVTGSGKVPSPLGDAGGWSGGVVLNDKIYGVPSNSNYVLIYDPLTNTIIGSEQIPAAVDTGMTQWIGGVGINGKAYFLPYNADSVLIFDPFDPVGGRCAEDGGCMSGRCQTHCCNVEEIKTKHLTCSTACGGSTVNGSCYPTLEIAAPSSAAGDLGWNRAKAAALGWPRRINVDEPVFFTAPPADEIRRAVVRKRFPLMSDEAQSIATNNLKFKMRWSPKKKKSGNGDDSVVDDDDGSNAIAGADYVGKRPPAGLQDDGQGADPGGTSVSPTSGAIASLPRFNGEYTMWLLLEDERGGDKLVSEYGFEDGDDAVSQEWNQVVVARWDVQVTGKPAFEVTSYTRASDDEQYPPAEYVTEASPTLACVVGETYKIAPIDLRTLQTIHAAHGSGGSSSSSSSSADDDGGGKNDGKSREQQVQFTLVGAPPGFFVSADTGEVLAVPKVATGNGGGEFVNAELYAVDASGAKALVETIRISVQIRDTADPFNGPNGAGCMYGDPVDEVPFDNAFACDCSVTKFRGDNCETEMANSGKVAGGLIGTLLIVLVFGTAAYKYRIKQISLRAFDFQKHLEELMAMGEIETDENSLGPRIPREIRRAHVTLTEIVGAGAFGQVWKAVLDELSVGGVQIPSYSVAVKTALDATGEGADELRREALVMSQVRGHPNVVALIGVVTSGLPLMLLLSLCENGSLQSCLKKGNCPGQNQRPLTAPPASVCAKMAVQIANGMHHLVKAKFVHRDLAARNILLDSQFECKIADFGLSRGVAASNPDDENAQEYYTSHGGTFPVRWTAPEAMEHMRFSTSTDIWSFGIVLLEIVTGGQRPYTELATNEVVITQVMGGYRAAKPERGCTPELYGVMLQCWEQIPTNRPSFEQLAAMLDQQLRDLGGGGGDGGGGVGGGGGGGGGSAVEYSMVGDSNAAGDQEGAEAQPRVSQPSENVQNIYLDLGGGGSGDGSANQLENDDASMMAPMLI